MAGHGGGTVVAGGTHVASPAAPAPGLSLDSALGAPGPVLWEQRSCWVLCECWVLKALCWPEPGPGDGGHDSEVSLQR